MKIGLIESAQASLKRIVTHFKSGGQATEETFTEILHAAHDVYLYNYKVTAVLTWFVEDMRALDLSSPTESMMEILEEQIEVLEIPRLALGKKIRERQANQN